MTEAVAHTHSPYAGTTHVVVLVLDELRVGLPLSSVERVVRVVESTMLPGAPDVVRGVVNVQGHVIPVLDVRSRFRLPERAIAPSDLMVIAHTTRRTVALVVDSVTGVLDCSGLARVAADDVLPELRYVQGLVKLGDGLVLIHDLETFLSLEETALLERALEHDA